MLNTNQMSTQIELIVDSCMCTRKKSQDSQEKEPRQPHLIPPLLH